MQYHLRSLSEIRNEAAAQCTMHNAQCIYILSSPNQSKILIQIHDALILQQTNEFERMFLPWGDDLEPLRLTKNHDTLKMWWYNSITRVP